ncbi:N-acyl-D-amino-acid deacylase family protein [Nocardioides marmoribigeumensis]|uniref:N-acyl-D-aspartate/D-glutamate deacylase n=1 Tax=Nocardioides marmoribigeumensis TaxID=433649 RepID=A0ABU2BUY8_9ACTN|nr:amidohydrolase family protein [Nocardioides marmoribigeumensis]MDR7362452.1 N-acyl-D-aspartate/D-glutamate deacylase [Nocardioides marmoribigeumensis]
MPDAPAPFDVVVRRGRWFDGTGAPSEVRDLGIREGRVVAISADELDATGCPTVIDAAGQWVLPGMVDIHTHYDVEVLREPALVESLRHGVTTILLGSCSLSTLHVDPTTAGDLFGRVEAIPRQHVIAALEEAQQGAGGWRDAKEYVDFLESLPLGPNLAAFVGHSDLRAAVMGLDRATREDVRPTAGELARMEELLEDALDAGFVGMSAQQLLFDKLDGEVCRSRTLPSTYARTKERRRLNQVLRARRRVLQGGPDITSVRSIAAMTLSSLPVGPGAPGGRGLRRPQLKTTLLSAADIKANPLLVHIMNPIAATLNRLGGDFRWQHLPVPFEVYADGIDLVIFEEFGSGAAALHLADQVERNALLQDEDYRRRFRKDYDERFGMRVWHRDFFDAEIVECPDDSRLGSLVGLTFGQVGIERGRLTASGEPLHPVDAFLDLVVEHGTKLRWRTTISNHRPRYADKLAVSPGVQMGFSDAGAHLRNMAFYDFGLKLLRRVHRAEQAGRPFMSLEHAVHRLTGELAEWYSLDAGHLRVGDRADLVVLDPAGLDDSMDDYAEAPVASYDGLPRMVNRSDRAVKAVLVNGTRVFGSGRAGDALGTERTGSFLRART